MRFNGIRVILKTGIAKMDPATLGFFHKDRTGSTKADGGYAIEKINTRFDDVKYIFHLSDAKKMPRLGIGQYGHNPGQDIAHVRFARSKRSTDSKTVELLTGYESRTCFAQRLKGTSLDNAKKSLIAFRNFLKGLQSPKSPPMCALHGSFGVVMIVER
jgi:hypothetical protein